MLGRVDAIGTVLEQGMLGRVDAIGTSLEQAMLGRVDAIRTVLEQGMLGRVDAIGTSLEQAMLGRVAVVGPAGALHTGSGSPHVTPPNDHELGPRILHFIKKDNTVFGLMNCPLPAGC
ncbi:unnamed protein product [Caretta caretta]